MVTMKYVILDWVQKKYCWVSVRIPDDKLPGGLICRPEEQIWAGEMDLLMDWKYEPRFKQHEKEYQLKYLGGINLS